MDYNKLFVFYTAAKQKRFSGAELNLSPSVVSRHVSDLEDTLGYKLFLRTPKGLVLTSKGDLLYHQAAECFQKIRLTQDLLSSTNNQIEEELDVFIPTAWASSLLVQHISHFIEKYPNICLNIMSDDSTPHIDSAGSTLNRVAILPYTPKDQNLVRRFLTGFQLGLYASQDYLDQWGTPQNVEELDKHRLIGSSGRDKNFIDVDWHLKVGLPEGQSRKPIIRLNNMAFAASESLGIASLAEGNQEIVANKLVRVLADVQGPTSSAYYIYPEYMRHSYVVKAFGDFLIESLTRKPL